MNETAFRRISLLYNAIVFGSGALARTIWWYSEIQSFYWASNFLLALFLISPLLVGIVSPGLGSTMLLKPRKAKSSRYSRLEFYTLALFYAFIGLVIVVATILQMRS